MYRNFFVRHNAFKSFSSQFREYRVKKRIKETREEEEDDVEIITASKKRTTFKSKVAPKKKIAKVKVESEGDGNGVGGWFDSEVLQMIALHDEMESKFVINGKKQGTF